MPRGAESPQPALPREDVRGQLVLLVEDNPEVRKVARLLLTDLGYPVLEAENALEAADMIENIPDITILLSDIVMPGGMDGAALARFARRFRPAMRIVLVSGYAKGLEDDDAEIHGFRFCPSHSPERHWRKPCGTPWARPCLAWREHGRRIKRKPPLSMPKGLVSYRKGGTLSVYRSRNTGGAPPTLKEQRHMAEDLHKRICLVEDDPHVARLIGATLRDFGFAHDWRRTGADLLRLLRSGEVPDLCIVDLGLPDMDGMELVRALRSDGRCGVLILTGRGDTIDRVMGLELGADDYMVKPFEPRELIARVRSILRRCTAPRDATRCHCPPWPEFAGWRFAPGSNTCPAPTAKAPPSAPQRRNC